MCVCFGGKVKVILVLGVCIISDLVIFLVIVGDVVGVSFYVVGMVEVGSWYLDLCNQMYLFDFGDQIMMLGLVGQIGLFGVVWLSWIDVQFVVFVQVIVVLGDFIINGFCVSQLVAWFEVLQDCLVVRCCVCSVINVGIDGNQMVVVCGIFGMGEVMGDWVMVDVFDVFGVLVLLLFGGINDIGLFIMVVYVDGEFIFMVDVLVVLVIVVDKVVFVVVYVCGVWVYVGIVLLFVVMIEIYIV